ncbi:MULTISPECIES: CidA/LrgA family protein [Deinococcus]|uniref:CidA/LrgA family protein n=1 Tax=Deinococcus cavernae TaxID=2320857 RepID=A0A418VAI1_9DEIO|nr:MULTISPECIES: CidA/LrgA family protein [Deinococcus]RJF73128.1 CidA/LrgA family protein [Deinococcus cavernae]
MNTPEPESITAHLPQPVRFTLGLGILSGFAALGLGLTHLLHLPLPGSVLGLLLLWVALGTRLIRLHWIEDAADGLLAVLGLLFVPATVGFIDFLGAGTQWLVWLFVMTAALLVGAGSAALIASRLVKP